MSSKGFLFIIILIFGISISGCLSEKIKQVPVLKVNVTLVEKEGIIDAENISITQGSVNIFDRPKNVIANSLPAISARATISKGINSTIGPWENIPYNGVGGYSFNIGFDENNLPKKDDTIHVSIYVIDKNKDRIGMIIRNIVWQ